MTDDDGRFWRRNERGLFVGIVLWTFGVGILAAFFPSVAVRLIEETDPLNLVGYMLFTIGVLSAIAYSAIVLIGDRGSTSELTDWDGENDG